MPELPEVETIVRTLWPRLAGRKIQGVSLRRADVIFPDRVNLAGMLVGRSLADIRRRGKKIVFALTDGNRFYIHLGMTGRLSLQLAHTPPAPHTHLILRLDGREIRFSDPRRFGGVFWLGKNGSADEGLGPEPLKMRRTQLARLLRRTTRAIKSALLDQSLIAGLGNIYADESLFAAGIHPSMPANKLSARQIARLSRGMKQVLRRALRHRGSTLRDYRDADGNAGDFQKLHRVYRRAGMPCVVCKTAVRRIVISGRSTHFCPKCQT
ncbi:MAG: bifunctional DNA-formamidopyrimidine glycosylase/DNA-(apurinic or apyrimidinic site) lyase [Tepidisphaeraceae bacterium]|jgi:formamidopyrimidine-DNA glycosylase